MLNDLADIANRRTLRHGQDQIVVGEMVALMISAGMRTINFSASPGSQTVRFGTPIDPLLHSVEVTVNRKTGNAAVSRAVLGSRATLTMTAYIKNYVSDPEDLVEMWRTNVVNSARIPMLGQIKLAHHLNSVTATSWQLVDLDDLADGTAEARQVLGALLTSSVTELRDVLEPYKRASLFEIDA